MTRVEAPSRVDWFAAHRAGLIEPCPHDALVDGRLDGFTPVVPVETGREREQRLAGAERLDRLPADEVWR